MAALIATEAALGIRSWALTPGFPGPPRAGIREAGPAGFHGTRGELTPWCPSFISMLLAKAVKGMDA